jgi:hypothetical protein
MNQEITGDALANEVRVTIIDAERALHDTMPTGMADVVLAALTAEPETLEELEAAVARYDEPIKREGLLKRLNPGLNETPWDAGVVIIDLPARLIVAVTEPALYRAAALGFALHCPDPPPDDWSNVPAEEVVWIRYRLPDDWLFVNSLEDWRATAERRRRERKANPPFDARPVLFGKVTEFIARKCALARIAGMNDPISTIHEEWLMTPREDLRGKTPREVLSAQRDFIDFDLDSRAHQWSFTGRCPPPLRHDSANYRFAGFGTHANVVYYDLLRYLLKDCWEYVQTDPSATLAGVTARLEKLKEEWLEQGDGEFSHDPGWVLEQERLRIPVTASATELLIDEDCEICQMQANPDFGPCFWHLDGSHMDLEDNWVFSFHNTREEWEAERREWEEHSRKFNEEWARKQAETQWAEGAKIFDDRQAQMKSDEEDAAPF